jgi:hypothetical protein
VSADRKGSITIEAALGSPHKYSSVKKIDNNTIALSLKVRNGVLSGESYVQVKLKNGSATVKDNAIVISNADEATIYITAGTTYKNYKDVTADPVAICKVALQKIAGKAYEQIKAAHITEYQKYFNTLSIDLGKSENEKLPTNQRIEQFAKSNDPSFVALYLQYGRYLLISSSRPGTRPANLQGIWNDLLTPPWGSKYTTNINAEMNYWPAELLNLSPMHEPLFKMIGELSEAGKKTAKLHYNAPGWVLHHNTDLWRGTAPINASNHGIWVTGGAWLCYHLWEHYLFTQDKTFLQNKAYPIMKQAALFFNSFLIPDPKTGYLISTPSNSPEQGGLVAGPTMDHQIIRSLFKNVIAASEILGIDKTLRDTLSEKYKRIAPNKIGKHGQLQEWMEDVDDVNNRHRHVSHLWGSYPGSEINWEETPELMSAARQSLIYRGDAATGWSLGWKINLWARFKDGDHTFKLIQMLLSPATGGAGSYPNLFDAHPPFQIDGNFGGAAGIGEMLVQSHTKYIDLLPALPSALPNGEVKGICARGGFVLDIKWSNGKLQQVSILSTAGKECLLRYDRREIILPTQKGKRYTITIQDFPHAAIRQDILLNDNWQTMAVDDPGKLKPDYYKSTAGINSWEFKQVNIPHNWDDYEGYRRLLHGNYHGGAWYRKTFFLQQSKESKRFFLFFEGVGSYATVYVNDKKVGEHAGGRTTFTIDITDAIKTDGSPNLLAVQALHPAGIKDLPWVCGGCSEERGFSEGSQPLGIFRPVHLIITNDIRIDPFGIHAWSDVQRNSAVLHSTVALKNYSNEIRNFIVTTQLVDAKGKMVAEKSVPRFAEANTGITVLQNEITVNDPMLWSTENPYLYKVVCRIENAGKIIDETETDFGFRTINWKNSTNQFLLNGKPVFINGVAEYEHLLGQSHAFSHEQIMSRMNWVKIAGFNGFRDGHQPHNLLYGQLCDQKGILWWTQLSAHIWYDTPEFRNNFKKLLREWVIERRNNPSVVLWGLQNESQLPEDFAKECTELIRQLDPTASSQRLVTTCNGGSGTDWDVPQNWTGTYGGNPATYASDVKKQVLIGEYGAWRTIDLHTEGPFVQNGILSEDRMTQLMEQKVRLAESVKDSSAGQFFWLLTSHDNPGRVQGGEGKRELDRVGPVNYKGLLTPWEEPLDVFYMFRANYASKQTDPMVYIVSHTWPERWTKPGKKDSIIVYSNCDEVELFNDINSSSMGKRRRNGVGTHFQWDGVNIKYNVLYAIGYVNGRAVAKDTIVLHYLPKSPNFNQLYATAKPVTKPQAGYNYIYRINCGGPEYRDENGNVWLSDRAQPYAPMMSPTVSLLYKGENNLWGCWYSSSWTDDFNKMPAFFASQRRTFDPIKGTKDWKLFQDFRYGKDKLRYGFPLSAGEYLVELYFIEPWLGIGGGMDASQMRLFDVAINGRVVLDDIDIWKEAGTNTVLKKTVKATVIDDEMVISFPESKAGQAIIAAVAIASVNKNIKPAPTHSIVTHLSNKKYKLMTWLDAGDRVYLGSELSFRSLPANLYGADWLQYSRRGSDTVSFILAEDAEVFIGMIHGVKSIPEGWEDTGSEVEMSDEKTRFKVYRKRYERETRVFLDVPLVMLSRTTQMQPAYDLKTITPYRTNVATVSTGVQKEQFGGRECTLVKSNSPVTIEWPIQTGVADIYSITVKYYYPADTVRGKMQVIGYGNTVLSEQSVNFTQTKAGKWNQFTINTGSMINAGNYTVKLTIENAEGLAISGIDVQ